MLKMQIIGRLGKDCTVNTVNGKNVINFSVAHTEKFNNQEKTTWVECAYWTDKTGISPYLVKGTQVFVEGNPDVKGYNRQDGSIGASLILRVREVNLLGSKADGAQSQPSYPSQSQQAAQPSGSSAGASSETSFDDSAVDDLPF